MVIILICAFLSIRGQDTQHSDSFSSFYTFKGLPTTREPGGFESETELIRNQDVAGQHHKSQSQQNLQTVTILSL